MKAEKTHISNVNDFTEKIHIGTNQDTASGWQLSAADYCVFRSLFLKGYKDLGLGIFFDKSEINIMWELGGNGPHSILKLTKPMKQAGILFARTGRDRLIEEKKKSYYWDFVRKTIDKLQKEGIVTTRTDPKNKRNPTIVELTFQGVVLYLRESTDKKRFIQATKHYPQYLPFSKNLEMLNKRFGQGLVYNALEQATKTFVDVRQAAFRIRPLNFEFQGFIEDIFVSGDAIKVLRGKNEKMAKLLQEQHVSVLRDSYIGYLAVHDLMRLMKQNKKNVEELLPNLDSEKELAYFERREVGSNSLFKGDRLKELFPKYASVEYFLTGMFVENLLWQERHIERQHDTYDFEVEF